jgi:hypothetical protein
MPGSANTRSQLSIRGTVEGWELANGSQKRCTVRVRSVR